MVGEVDGRALLCPHAISLPAVRQAAGRAVLEHILTRIYDGGDLKRVEVLAQGSLENALVWLQRARLR